MRDQSQQTRSQVWNSQIEVNELLTYGQPMWVTKVKLDCDKTNCLKLESICRDFIKCPKNNLIQGERALEQNKETLDVWRIK